MDLDELEAGRARLEIEYKGRPLTIEYRPDMVGMSMQHALASAATPPHDTGPVVEQLMMLVTAWSLTRGGQPVPVDAEHIGALPMGLSMAICQQIMEDFADPKSPVPTATASASSTPSPAISEPTADSATSPPLPGSSSMRDGRASRRGSSPASPIRLGA